MGNSRTILLVGDDAAERTRLEQAFVSNGCTVMAVASGEEAVWKLDNESCDALLTTIALRGMSGLELTAQARASKAGLPIIVMAADGSEAVRKQASAAGATEFLRMPVTPDQIAALVARVLPIADADLAAVPEPGNAPEAGATQPRSEPIRRLKNIILFLLAPFVGLVYLLSFPIVGLGMLIWTTLAWKKRKAEEAGHLSPAPAAKRSVLSSAAMVPGAFLLGMVFAIVGPILGIGVLLWFSFQAWGRIGAKALTS
jgi:CheY-like chemotaxis protein